MLGRTPRIRSLSPIGLLVLLGGAGSEHWIPAAAAREPEKPRYDLPRLIKFARAHYPGLEAARQAIEAVKHDLFRAKWAWLPQGELKGFFAPAPEIKCLDAQGAPSETQCVETTSVDAEGIRISGVMARVVLEVGMPLYTFDKLGSAKRAAQAGIQARTAQLRSAIEDLELKVTQAYWGVKLARELLYTISQGRKHLDKGLKRVEREVQNQEGEATVTDLLRLKTAAAEVDVREGEARKLENLALAALATLTGLKSGSFDLDKPVLQPMQGELGPLAQYIELAHGNRPELKAIESALEAQNAVVTLEKARFFPDFLLVGQVGYGVAPSVDDPKNAFLSDPFNFVSAGFGLALSWKLDSVQQYGKYGAARATANEVASRRKEAIAGVELEIDTNRAELIEAKSRLAVAKRGQKSARSWLVATSQNIQAGLSESKDLTDALIAFFQLRVRYLQAMFDVNVGWAKLRRAVGVAQKRLARAP